MPFYPKDPPTQQQQLVGDAHTFFSDESTLLPPLFSQRLRVFAVDALFISQPGFL